jgi:cytochrome b6-f complex iron-sulfur subunit
MDELHETPIAACANCSAARAAGVDRRTFLSAATLAAVATILQACGAAGADFFTGPSGGSLTVKLADFPALSSTGGIARVDNGNGAPTALVRTGASSFLGVTMVCTHQGATIGIDGAGFRCPNHGAMFSSTGVWQGGQQTSSLRTFTATFDGVNTVTIARP